MQIQVPYGEIARRLGISPLQVLVEIAAMKQPWQDCWPNCDEGFEATIRERRRIRLGFPITGGRTGSRPGGEQRAQLQALPVSGTAAAVLNKLISKGYGLKPVKVFTLTKKWVHGATEEDIRELVRRGNLEWTDPERTAVNLAVDRIGDTERIVDLFRRREAGE